MTDGAMDGTAPESSTELPAWQQIAFFFLACLILISRRPSAIFHAQFYAEDGHVWFADAYNLGWWHALLRAQDGYFQTFSRLGGALALLAPLACAPLVLNVLAFLAQALPVSLLLSARSDGWGSLRFRAMLAAAYLALPDFGETGFGITESQWVLALCVFLLVVARVPRGAVGRGLALALIGLSGLSGPFCIFLLPLAVFAAWKRREAWRWTPVAMLTACALIQAYALLVIDRHGRLHFPMGATPELFVRILSANVILGTVFGYTSLGFMPGIGVFIFLLVAAIGGCVLLAVCFLRGQMEMRLLLVFAGMIFFASLLSPVVYPPKGYTVWDVLAQTRCAHYWFIPSIAFAWCLLMLMMRSMAGEAKTGATRTGATRAGAAKAGAMLFLLAMTLGVIVNWELPPFKDMHYADYAKSFASAPAGTVMTVPENPGGWTLTLTKRAERH